MISFRPVYVVWYDCIWMFCRLIRGYDNFEPIKYYISWGHFSSEMFKKGVIDLNILFCMQMRVVFLYINRLVYLYNRHIHLYLFFANCMKYLINHELNIKRDSEYLLILDVEACWRTFSSKNLFIYSLSIKYYENNRSNQLHTCLYTSTCMHCTNILLLIILHLQSFLLNDGAVLSIYLYYDYYLLTNLRLWLKFQHH